MFVYPSGRTWDEKIIRKRSAAMGRWALLLFLLHFFCVQCSSYEDEESHIESYRGPVHYSDGDDDVTGSPVSTSPLSSFT